MNRTVWGVALLLAVTAPGCKRDAPQPATSPAGTSAHTEPAAAPAEPAPAPAPQTLAADAVTRLDPKEVQRKVAESGALLVCAYESAEKFAANKLEGAIARSDFEAQREELPRDKELIFYCS